MRSWELLGYDVRGDHGGGATTSWTAEKPLFTDVDKDHIIRWFVGGYYDDSLGSICGVANAAIDNPPAIYSWLWQKHLRQSPSTINVNSFADARNLSFSGDFVQMLMVLLNQDDDVFKAFGLLDQMGLMDTVLDGDGVLQCRKHSDSAPVVRVLRDRDYQSFEMRYDPKILFREVRVWGSYRQSLQKFETYLDSPAFTDAAAPIKTGATDIFNLYGYLSRASITGGLCLLPNYYARLFKKVPRIVQLSTVGQLIDTFIGDKISLYASKALSPTGTLSGEVFRIFNLTHDYLTGMTTCEAVENVQILT
jgi:hypothetical protein